MVHAVYDACDWGIINPDGGILSGLKTPADTHWALKQRLKDRSAKTLLQYADYTLYRAANGELRLMFRSTLLAHRALVNGYRHWPIAHIYEHSNISKWKSTSTSSVPCVIIEL